MEKTLQLTVSCFSWLNKKPFGLMAILKHFSLRSPSRLTGQKANLESVRAGWIKHRWHTFGIFYADCYAWDILRFVCNIRFE